LKTQDKHSLKTLFGYESEALKIVEKPCRRALKNTCKNLNQNLAKTPFLLVVQKLIIGARWPAGRPANEYFYDRWGYRSTAWSTVPWPQRDLLSVCRLCGRPPLPETWVVQSVGRSVDHYLATVDRSVDRAKDMGLVHVFLHINQSLSRLSPASVDRSVGRQ